jgi:nicotinamidase-related amidase
MDKNQALLVIDMQEGLLQREIYQKQELINNINSLLSEFHSKCKPVFLIRHTNNSFSKENSNEWQLCNKLSVIDKDIIVNKNHSSIFKEKQFLSLIKESKITEIVVAGLVSNGCVKEACLDGQKLGLSVILISDGHSTFQKDAAIIVGEWNVKLNDEGIKVISAAEFLND